MCVPTKQFNTHIIRTLTNIKFPNIEFIENDIYHVIYIHEKNEKNLTCDIYAQFHINIDKTFY